MGQSQCSMLVSGNKVHNLYPYFAEFPFLFSLFIDVVYI